MRGEYRDVDLHADHDDELQSSTARPMARPRRSSRLATRPSVRDCLFAGYSPNTVTVGNDTAQLFAACNNQAAPCTVAAINGLGDPAGGCQKDYRAHYSCNGAAVKEIFVCGSAPPNGGVDTEYPAIPGGYPAPHGTCEASGQPVTLTCP